MEQQQVGLIVIIGIIAFSCCVHASQDGNSPPCLNRLGSIHSLACDAQISNTQTAVDVLISLISAWVAANTTNATVCFSAGVFDFQTRGRQILIPPNFSIALVGSGMGCTTLNRGFDDGGIPFNASNSAWIFMSSMTLIGSIGITGATETFIAVAMNVSSSWGFVSFGRIRRLELRNSTFSFISQAVLATVDFANIDTCNFFNNSAAADGPGWVMAPDLQLTGMNAESRATITHSSFTNSSCTSSICGSVMTSGLSLTVSWTSFITGNIDNPYGALHFYRGPTLEVFNSQFRGNVAGLTGMAIYAEALEAFYMFNSSILDNSAPGALGFPVNASVVCGYGMAVPNMQYMTFAGNTIGGEPCADWGQMLKPPSPQWPESRVLLDSFRYKNSPR